MLVASLGFGVFGLVGGATTMDLLAVSMSCTSTSCRRHRIIRSCICYRWRVGIGALLAGSLFLLTPMLPTLLALGGMALGSRCHNGSNSRRSRGRQTIPTTVWLLKLQKSLTLLIGLMSQGGDINMDGKKVGEVLALARGPMGT